MDAPQAQTTSAGSGAPPIFRRVGTALLVGGVLFLLAAAGAGLWRAAWLARARHAQGTVTDMQRQMSTSGSVRTPMYRPVVTFTADDGRVVAINGGVWSSSTPYRYGDTVRVDYAPGRPGGAVMDDAVQRWFLTGFLLFFGAVMTFIGVVFRRVSGAAAGGRWTTTTYSSG